ncbi:MAG TPA: cache domain-containing protein, partial [Allocoleopsis sp.]
MIKSHSRKLRLRTTLVVPFVAQLIITVGLVGYLSFINGQKAVNDLADQLNTQISSRIEQHVMDYLNKSQHTLLLTNMSVKSGNLDLQDFTKLRRYFWQIVHRGESEGYVLYGNEQGEFVGVEYQDNGTVQLKIRTKTTEPLRRTYLLDQKGEPEKLLTTAKYDTTTRPWYKAAKQAKKPTWSEIYPFFSRKNTVLGISPVYPILDNNNQMLGVLSINIRLTQITDFINNLFVSTNGQSFIIERSGNLVASSKIPQPFKVIGTGDNRTI